LNEEIWKLLEEYNAQKMQGLNTSRTSIFEEIEKDALRTLPKEKFELAYWKKAKANIDYHIVLEKCFYSVPYKLRGKQLQVRYTDYVVEIFESERRVASHKKLDRPKTSSTVKEHMPVGHREYSDWSPSRIINWGRKIGPCCSILCTRIMDVKEHPELGYRSCMGIIRLEKKYSKERLENACKRALKIGGLSFKSVNSILSKGLDYQEVKTEKSEPMNEHKNVRGSDYYQ
jgi:transposase